MIVDKARGTWARVKAGSREKSSLLLYEELDHG